MKITYRLYFNLSNKVQIFGLPVSIQYQHTKCRDTTMYRFFPLYIHGYILDTQMDFVWLYLIHVDILPQLNYNFRNWQSRPHQLNVSGSASVAKLINCHYNYQIPAFFIFSLAYSSLLAEVARSSSFLFILLPASCEPFSHLWVDWYS